MTWAIPRSNKRRFTRRFLLRHVLADQRGDLLIDAIVGTVLIGLAAALIGPLFSSTRIAGESTQKQTQAAGLARSILEDVQALPFSSVTSSGLATALAEANYPNIGTPAQSGWQVARGGTIYSVSLSVGEVWGTNGHERKVTASLTWPGGGSLTRSATVTDSLTSAPPTKPAAGSWITEFSFEPSSGGYMITAGPDGNLWFTQSSANKIGKITPSGVVTQYAVPTASSAPKGITAGPDGNLWFTEFGANKIGRITPAGVITEFALGAAAQPIGITGGPDGNLWFVEYGMSKVGKITTSGAITKYSIAAGSGPHFITAGPDGNLWFTEWSRNKIGKITTSGVVTEYSLPTVPYRQPLCITAGPDGNLWFTESAENNKIGKMTTSGILTEYPTPPAPPIYANYNYCIAAGPDGNLWFTAQGANTIGRITPSGTVTQFNAATANGPTGITTGPDNNIWFVDYYVSRVGRVSPGG